MALEKHLCSHPIPIQKRDFVHTEHGGYVCILYTVDSRVEDRHDQWLEGVNLCRTAARTAVAVSPLGRCVISTVRILRAHEGVKATGQAWPVDNANYRVDIGQVHIQQQVTIFPGIRPEVVANVAK